MFCNQDKQTDGPPPIRMCSEQALETRLVIHEIIVVYYCQEYQEVKLAAVLAEMAKKPENSAPTIPGWTFLSNHGHVLLCLAAEPGRRLRDVAAHVGITERTVQRIVTELEDAQYLERKRKGRRNRYELRPTLHLRHPVEGHRTIGELIDFVIGPGASFSDRQRSRKAVGMNGSTGSSGRALRSINQGARRRP